LKSGAISGFLALAICSGSTEIRAQETVVIGGSGLPAVEVHLETALAPTGSVLRVPRGGPGERGLLLGERPPLVDMSSFRRSMLPEPAPKARPRVSSAATPRKPNRDTASSASRVRKPRAGTRIPAVSLAAEIGPKGGALAQTAALSNPTPAKPLATLPAKLKPAVEVGPATKSVPAAKLPPAPPPPAVKLKPLAVATPLAKAPPMPPPIVKAERPAAPPPVPQLPEQTTIATAQPRAAAPPLPTVAASKPPKSTPAVRRTAEETKVAAVPLPKVPSSRATAPNGVLTRLIFPARDTDVSGPLAEQLDTVAQTMRTRDERLLLQAYAAGSQSGGASGSRRLSLARALEVRSYLIRKGLKSTRIDVRALGTPDASGPADRVDIILLSP